MIRSLLITTVNGNAIFNWSYNDDEQLIEKQTLLAGSVISTVQIYAKEVFLSRIQKIEMDSGTLYVRGESSDNLNTDSVDDNSLIISAFVDQEDNDELVNEILGLILNKVNHLPRSPAKLIEDPDLISWINQLLKNRTKIRDYRRIVYASVGTFFAFFISTFFIGLNYSFWLDKVVEESLQVILGLIVAFLLVIPSCFLAGNKKNARLASIIVIPFNFLSSDYLIRNILTGEIWEQSVGNPMVFLGFLIFVSIIGSQIGGNLAERRFLYPIQS